MENIAAIFIFVTSTVFHKCLCYSTGAPAGRCESMMPNHDGANGQTGQSPYEVKVDKTYYMPGGNVRLSIQSSTENIKGFLVEARKVGESAVIGTFTTPPEKTEYVTCNSNAKGAITHSEMLAVKRINFTWEPSESLSGNISFFATVVKDKATFWVKLESPELYKHMSIVPSSTLQTSIATSHQPMASATIAATNSTMYSTPVVMSSTTNSTCKYADKAKCGGTQLHHNIVFLFLMGLFLAFWQN